MARIRFRRGDPVQFSFGTRRVDGVVVEDRGPIGVGGRHLYLIQFRAEPQSQSFSLVELPAEQLLPAKRMITAK